MNLYTPSTDSWTKTDIVIRETAQFKVWDGKSKLKKGQCFYCLMDDTGSKAYIEVGYRWCNVLERYIGKDLGYELGTQFASY